MHYTSLIDRYKGDVAKTWQVLNDITGKRKTSELCDTFNINSVVFAVSVYTIQLNVVL